MLKYMSAIEVVENLRRLRQGVTGVRVRITRTTAQKVRSEYARPTNKYLAAKWRFTIRGSK